MSPFRSNQTIPTRRGHAVEELVMISSREVSRLETFQRQKAKKMTQEEAATCLGSARGRSGWVSDENDLNPEEERPAGGTFLLQGFRRRINVRRPLALPHRLPVPGGGQ